MTLADIAAQKNWEILVVGAGPAGASLAHHLAAAGLQVLLVDKQIFPRYKVCGGCLSARAVAALRQAGLSGVLERAGAQRLRQFVLASTGHIASLTLPEGRVVPRAAFDAALVEAAMAAGAAFIPGCHALLASAGEGRRKVILQAAGWQHEIHAHVVIGADGLAGSLRKHYPELHSHATRPSYVGAGTVTGSAAAYFESGTIYMAHGRTGYAGAVRVGHEQLMLAAALSADSVRRAGNLAQAVRLVLEDAGFPAAITPQDWSWRGTPALTRHVPKLAAHRFFALGDAAGYVEPFTGEGITWALRSAQALVPLVLRGLQQWSPSLEKEWKHVHRRVVGRRQWACRMIARALRHPGLITTLVRLAENHWLSLAPVANYLHWDATENKGRLRLAP